MKTDIYKFDKSVSDISSISGIAAKIAAYNDLDKKQELRLTLLCEELVSMLPNLLRFGTGEFWIENKGKDFEIHVVVKAENPLSYDTREEILSVSSSGKNAAGVGIMNKIRLAAEVMLASYAETAGTVGFMAAPDTGYSFYNQGCFTDPTGFSCAWSLDKYRNEVSEGTDEWDELEKSIIANMADDVIVGIIGGKVDIIIKKSF